MTLTALLAVAYDSPAVALLALVGGLLTPLLLASEHDQYVSLFVYLSCLAAAAVGSRSCGRGWPCEAVALVGVEAVYWAWYTGNYHPRKANRHITFLVVIFVLFVASVLLAPRRRWTNIEDLVLVVLNPFLFFIAAYRLLDGDYRLWMGTLAVSMALVCTLAAVLVDRWRQQDASSASNSGFSAARIARSSTHRVPRPVRQAYRCCCNPLASRLMMDRLRRVTGFRRRSPTWRRGERRRLT